MSKKRKYVALVLSVIAIATIFLMNLNKVDQVAAEEEVEINFYPIIWKDDIIGQGGKLKFGLSLGRELKEAANPGFGGTLQWVPNVTYMDTPEKEIRHLFDGRPYDKDGFPDYGTPPGTPTNQTNVGSTHTFHLIQTDDEYAIEKGSMGTGPHGLAIFDKVVLLPKTADQTEEIQGTGFKLTDQSLKLSVNMKANADNSAVSHVYEVTNTSEETKTIYPLKMVDTQLNYDDWVVVYSRGQGKGLYIEGREQPGRKNEKIYRLDYIMDTDDPATPDIHQPLYYRGIGQNTKYDKVFGADKDNQGTPDVLADMSKKDGVEVLPLLKDPANLDEYNDSGIYMSWGKVTLEKGESYKMRYDVGIKPMQSLEMTKTHENLTRTDGTFQVGDEIEYTITMTSPKDGYEDVTIKDLIPRGFEEPDPTSDITFTHTAGPIASVKMAAAYTKNEDANVDGIGTIKLPVSGKGYDFKPLDTMTIKFKVKLAAEAAGMKEIKNTALVSGTSEGGSNFTDDPVIDEKGFDVEDARPITVKYVDLAGNPLPDVTNETITGQLGEKKTIPTTLNGYAFDHASGPLEMTITTADQEITLFYKENRFTIKQEAFKEGNVSATTVKVEDQIDYKVTVESHLDPGQTYQNFVINGKISGVIEDVKDFKLVSSANAAVELKTPVDYDSTTGVFKATVIPSDNVPSDANLILTYTGKVEANAEPTNKITAEARANGNYSDGMSAKEVKASDFVSIVSAGKLSFESAPKNMSFGENINVSTIDKVYPMVSKDAPLSVKDLRGSNSQWTMVARVTKVLTNSAKGNHELPNALYFKQAGSNKPLELNKDFVLTTHTTTSTNVIDISKNWSNSADHPFVKVKAGEAVTGAYNGTIKWTLRDGI